MKGARLIGVTSAVAGLALASLGFALALKAGRVRQNADNRPHVGENILLSNRWHLTPAGTAVKLLGDMPGTILTTPDGRYAIVNTCGFHNHSLNLVDLNSGKIASQIDLGQDWYGMVMRQTEAGAELLVSGASGKPFAAKHAEGGIETLPDRAAILQLAFTGEGFVPKTSFSIPGTPKNESFTSGLALEKDGSLLALNIQGNTLYHLGAQAHEVIAQVTVGYRPYGVAVSPDGDTIAVSNWGDGTVSLLTPDFNTIATVATGKRPNALTFGPDGRLYVANSGDDSVSVIQNGAVIEKVRTTLMPKDPIGAAPIALALSADGHRLYVADADNNDVAVIDTTKPRQSHVLGFIPTGRYPSAIALTRDEKRLLIGTAKGMQDQANVDPDKLGAEKDEDGGIPHIYIGDQLTGTLSIVDVPDSAKLKDYTKAVFANRPLPTSPGLSPAQIKERLAALKNIHHVVYIIKENRTYDQVLGDIGKGNSEPRLTMFGEKVTPNEHALVNTFTLLDNLYCDGEVSQVGHQWTDAGYAGDYTQKQWILSYSGRQEIESDTRLSSSPGGFIWQDAQKHGKTTRIYGEYLQWQEDHNSAHGEVKRNPEKFGCSAAFERVFARYGRDTEKAEVFLKEMHDAEATGNWPNLMVMALNEDHTRGLSAGAYTPSACVASNDQAVGMVIEGISHSKFWKDTAVFIIQDDGQDGPDHVDAHRTTGYFISPYVARGIVDSTQYSTTSMLHTMEIILDLPPMSQYDAAASPMLGSVTAEPDFTPYTLIPPKIDLKKRNPSKGALARRSAKLDFSDIDKADPDELNAILWAALKPGEPMPAPVHSLFSR
jgi:YVTN family beta-propeller protein